MLERVRAHLGVGVGAEVDLRKLGVDARSDERLHVLDGMIDRERLAPALRCTREVQPDVLR